MIKEKGFWLKKENRLNELKEFIESGNKINELRHIYPTLYEQILKHDRFVEFLIEELGYDIDNIMPIKTKGFFKNFEEVKKRILKFINKEGRFPLFNEITDNLKIGRRYIAMHGGINGLKSKIKHDDVLVDLRGDYNKSVGELMFANFLVSNNLTNKYKREQKPFAGLNFRSDFTFYLKDKEIHVEIWGYPKENMSGKSIEYNKKRAFKEEVYSWHKDNIVLISIEYKVFNLNYIEMQKCFMEVLNPYIPNLIEVEYEKIIFGSKLSDLEIFNSIKGISDNKNKKFPTTNELRNYNSSLYYEIKKRGYTYIDFAKKFGYELAVDYNDFNEDDIFECFSSIYNSNKIIDKTSILDYDNCIYSYIVSMGGIAKYKLIFLLKNQPIKEEIQWLINIANNRPKTNTKIYEADIQKAIDVLNHWNIKDLYSDCIGCGSKIYINNEQIYFCEKCIKDKRNINRNTFWHKYTEREYEENFNQIINKDVSALLPDRFNELSNEISVRGYTNYYGINWFEVIKKYKKENELYEYLRCEYINLGAVSKNDFVNKHKHLKYNFLLKIDNDVYKERISDRLLRYTEKDFKDNFLKIKLDLGRAPLFVEFQNNTNISYNTYQNHFDLSGKVYDSIVKMYVDSKEYDIYLNNKKNHKTLVGKKTGSMSQKHTLEDLESNFIKIFDSYKIQHDKYPSKKAFSKISNIDESTYRKRLGKRWSEVCNYYGYN